MLCSTRNDRLVAHHKVTGARVSGAALARSGLSVAPDAKNQMGWLSADATDRLLHKGPRLASSAASRHGVQRRSDLFTVRRNDSGSTEREDRARHHRER
jgi:hypothetical protein